MARSLATRHPGPAAVAAPAHLEHCDIVRPARVGVVTTLWAGHRLPQHEPRRRREGRAATSPRKRPELTSKRWTEVISSSGTSPTTTPSPTTQAPGLCAAG